MHEVYYQNKVYPLQDEILDLVKSAPVAFYLTGGTALSRFYLNHRYSDDLDRIAPLDPALQGGESFTFLSIRIRNSRDTATESSSLFRKKASH